jgi:hypothetical protein
VEETRADIAEMHRLMRAHVPGAKILFTVSPVPLAATFRPVSCLTANHVSKAILRAALDEFLRSKPEELGKSLFYFPSMEIVQLGFLDPWAKDIRHPASYVLDTVMKTFEATYCVGEGTLEDANRLLQMFRARNAQEISERFLENEESVQLALEAQTTAKAGKMARRAAKRGDVKLGREKSERRRKREIRRKRRGRRDG